MSDLLRNLKARGMVDTPRGMPVSDFTGVFREWHDKETEFDGRKSENLVLGFSDVDIIESREPYDLPTVEIILYMGGATSAFGYFFKSLEPVTTGNSVMEMLDSLIGKKVHMKRTPGHLIYSMEMKKKVEKDCWELVSADVSSGGVATGGSAWSTAINMLNGRSIQEFNGLALRDAGVKKDPWVFGLITKAQFAAKVTGLGVATVKDGKYEVQVDAAVAMESIARAS